MRPKSGFGHKSCRLLCHTLSLLTIFEVLQHVQCQDIIFGEDRPSSPARPTDEPSYRHHYHHPYRHRRPHFYHSNFHHHNHPHQFPSEFKDRDDSFSEGRRPPAVRLPLIGELNLGEAVRNPIGTLQSLLGSIGGQKQEKTTTEAPIVATPPPRPAEQHHNHNINGCQTMHGTPGVCVPLRDCDSLQRLMRGRPRSTANRILRESACSGNFYSQRVCCGETGTSGDQVGPENPFDNLVATKPPPPAPTTRKPIPIPAPTNDLGDCGYRNEAHSRIVGGRESAIGSWPWIAALGYRDANTGKMNYLCGGALLTKSHIVTAAHCTHNRKDLVSVRLGDHDLFSDSDGVVPVELPVNSVIQNPDYNPTSYQNDIAIIKLKRPIDSYTSQIHPICLPSTPELRSSSFEGTSPFVAGWGSTQFNGPSSSKLMEVQLPVVPLSKCQDKYKLFKNIRVDQTNICAGHERGGRDSCQGDSGGPLMHPIADKKYAIIGVVSFGYKCAEPGYPGVYTRITSHLDWIQETIRNSK